MQKEVIGKTKASPKKRVLKGAKSEKITTKSKSPKKESTTFQDRASQDRLKRECNIYIRKDLIKTAEELGYRLTWEEKDFIMDTSNTLIQAERVLATHRQKE